MKMTIRASLLSAMLIFACITPARSETTDCTIISAIPTTITIQGVYCLTGDLATNMASGAMITIATNNVSIDFNRHKLGGQAAGPATNATGVYANGRLNVQIRNGVIRGFRKGIDLEGGSGHFVEGMILDGNTEAGIYIQSASNAIVQANQVVNTGGTNFATDTFGIYAHGTNLRVVANDISLTTRNSGGVQNAFGIRTFAFASVFDDNRITNNADYGIYSSNNQHVSISRNRIHNSIVGGAIGIRTNAPNNCICRDNTVTGYATSLSCGQDGGGNVVSP